MNNDAPETLAAARSRAADLEQQLKLSDEGVSRLAQRCLELEQQVLNYQAALARHGSDNEPAALTLPQLFYDSGSGYSPRECRAMNGIQLQEDCLLFLDVDPNLTVQSTVPFAAGMKFAVTYHYYPLGRFQHEQPGKALLQALSAIKLRAEAEQNDLRGQLQAALAENTRLNNQLTELQNSRAAYENSLENLYESSSWRLTAPLRALHRLFRH